MKNLTLFDGTLIFSPSFLIILVLFVFLTLIICIMLINSNSILRKVVKANNKLNERNLELQQEITRLEWYVPARDEKGRYVSKKVLTN